MRTLIFFCLSLFFTLTVNIKTNTAQKKVTSSCTVVSDNRKSANKKITGIKIENNSKEVIKWLFEFENNGFYDEPSLIRLLMNGVDSLKSKEFNQLLILENIAKIIKSPNHRNFHLLFSTVSPSATNRKYSPMAMITSFYDKQCHDYQRLAAQMAIITPYFKWQDFKSYYIIRHNVIDVKVGDEYIFHDFDPGEPGFRFYKNADKTKFASFSDLMNDISLITKDQFYTYNEVNLCPWISETYYRSLFGKLNGQSNYLNLDKVFGFIPKWILPQGSEIISYFPDTTLAGRFGTKISLNNNDPLIKKTFQSYSKYLTLKNAKDSLKTNIYLTKYLKKNFNFDFNIDYFFLISKGLIEQGSSTAISTTLNNNYLRVIINTGNDTIIFLKDYLIPLPLRKVDVKKGEVFIIETEFTDKGWKDYSFKITDSLVFDLLNYSPPIFTSADERKSKKLEASNLIYGPSNGYILPHSTVEFEYYYNPFYYSFHNLIFNIRYDSECKNNLDVFLIED